MLQGDPRDDPWQARIEALKALDRLRRGRGEAYDRWGAAPAPAPSEIVREWPGLRLRRYRQGTVGVILIVPATIKRWYIWDLAAGASPVRRLIDAGWTIFLAEWTDPGDDPGGEVARLGLGDYAGRLLGRALDIVSGSAQGGRVVLAGHSLGGTFAALHAAAGAECVRALLLVEAPLAFGAQAGAFAPLVAAARGLEPGRDAGPVPGSLLNLASAAMAPEAFVWERLWDRLTIAGDPGLWSLHMRVERWSLDEFAMPAPLFRDVVDLLYREDRFARGQLDVAGRRAEPGRLGRLPVLAVVDPGSRVVPPASALGPLRDGGGRPVVLEHGPDPGTALRHVAALVGREAHRTLWPDILSWLRALAP